MATQIRTQDLKIRIGTMKKGPLNKITDVSGVLVGHATIDNENNKTGVTVVMPCRENVFLHKMTAAAHVLNDFGKTLGLVQVEELGSLETPIALTNTLNVGLVHDALVEYTLRRCKKDKMEPRSINPVVCECNDATLNDIANRVVSQDHVFQAIEAACADFEEGDVGGGKGMVCYGLKGGIGSASRQMEIEGKIYTLGVLVQANYGRTDDLILQGDPIGKSIRESWEAQADLGSIIMIVATDLPLCARQLKRVIKRAGVGMARLGSYMGNGSGEVMVGFTTENRLHHMEKGEVLTQHILREDLLDLPFRAAGECCEEAILNAMLCADTVQGVSGAKKISLRSWLEAHPKG